MRMFWPLFPKWGHDEGHANGIIAMMALGAVGGIIYRKQVIGFGKNLLGPFIGYPVNDPRVRHMSLEKKKSWIHSNVLQ